MKTEDEIIQNLLKLVKENKKIEAKDLTSNVDFELNQIIKFDIPEISTFS